MRCVSKATIGVSLIIVFIVGGIVYATLVARDPPVVNGAPTEAEEYRIRTGESFCVSTSGIYRNLLMYGGSFADGSSKVKGILWYWTPYSSQYFYVNLGSTFVFDDVEYVVIGMTSNAIRFEEIK